MKQKTLFYGVPIEMAVMNALVTTALVLIANGRLLAAIVFIPLHVGLRWLCKRHVDRAHPSNKESKCTA